MAKRNETCLSCNGKTNFSALTKKRANFQKKKKNYSVCCDLGLFFQMCDEKKKLTVNLFFQKCFTEMYSVEN